MEPIFIETKFRAPICYNILLFMERHPIGISFHMVAEEHNFGQSIGHWHQKRKRVPHSRIKRICLKLRKIDLFCGESDRNIFQRG